MPITRHPPHPSATHYSLPHRRFVPRYFAQIPANGTVALALLLLLALLANSGCMRVATAPARLEQREQAESVLGRLAELTPDQIARFLDQRMATQLELNDNQQVRVNAINLDHAQELHAIAASSDSVRAKVRALRKQNNEHEAELKEVLTADQFTRFLAMKEEMRETLKNLRSEK